MTTGSLRAYVMAVDRVEKLLRRVTAALDAKRIRYAVVGGNAVAARADRSAVRATKDVDRLVRRGEVQRITVVMTSVGFRRHDLRRLVVFTDPDEPSRRAGAHLVWADELVRASYICPAPSVTEAVQAQEGFWLLDLPALVRMKLTSHRDIDRVHVSDLLSVGLIDQKVRDGLPMELNKRLHDVEASVDT